MKTKIEDYFRCFAVFAPMSSAFGNERIMDIQFINSLARETARLPAASCSEATSVSNSI